MARGRVLMLDAAYRPLAEEHAEFTVTAPVSVGMAHREVWLLGLPQDEDEGADKVITHAAVAERGRRVASLDRQVRLFSFVEFEPLALEEVRSAVLPRHRPHIATSTPPAAWSAALLAVERLRPDAAQDLRRLRRLVGETIIRSVSGPLRLEKDAVGLALEMSGMGRKRYLREWLPPNASAGFLSGLSSVRLREDQVVQHDAGVFGDWSVLGSAVTGGTVFRSRAGERLTVLNTNRTPVERALGVDLVYYTHRYCGFVIVQYKMFRDENGKWSYRPDEQFEEELRRMRGLPAAKWDGSSASFRLSADPRYLKLCWPQSDDPTSTELVKGRYLPVEFWEGAEDGLFRGKRDGLVIRDESLDRSFTNSEFVDLVAAGWIGTRGAPTKTIEEVILASLDASRSVMLAVHTPSGREEDGEERGTSG